MPVLNAEENILLPVTLAGREPDRAWFEQLVATVGLTDRLTHRPSELSGGQQQRVAIARALVHRPAVVFADEPTGNLDSSASAEVLGLLRRAADEFGQTIVMVTHDAERRLLRRPPRRPGRRAHRARRGRRRHRFGARAHEERGVNRIAFRGLRERKARTFFTLAAVVLGVALISGTFVLTDTISKSFDHLVATAGENVDVKVLSRNQGEGFGAAPTTFPASVKARVRKVDGVAAADGSYRQLSVTVARARRSRGPDQRRADACLLRRRRSASIHSSTRAAPPGPTARSRSPRGGAKTRV